MVDTACSSVVLQNLVTDPTATLTIDATTVDADGNIWQLSSLQGWWDSTDVTVSRQAISPVGEFITAAHENGRALVLEALVTTPTPDATKLGDLWAVATERAKAAARTIYVPGLITVTDPLGPKHAQVRRVGAVKSVILGDRVAVLVHFDLLCPDPMRYDADDQPFD